MNLEDFAKIVIKAHAINHKWDLEQLQRVLGYENVRQAFIESWQEFVGLTEYESQRVIQIILSYKEPSL